MNPIQTLHDKIENAALWEKEICLQRNEYLKYAGSTDTNVYYVDSGSLVISFDHNDDSHIIRFGYAKNLITALDSFITEQPSPLSIKALKKSKLKSISKNKYFDFIVQDPVNKEIWDRSIELLIVQQMEREFDILITSPQDRYERVLKRSPQLFQEIPSRYIANYLRMTPETLSRLKKS